MENINNQSRKKLLPVITGAFVGTLLISNILASKILNIGGFIFDGGTLLFPFSYIFADVLTEVYGYKDTRKVIWTGFVMLLFASFNIWIISILPADESWDLQKSFDSILLQMPRIAIGSVVAYFVGEYSNSVILSKMKVKTKGKHLWLRTIGSTLVGELLDSAIFVCIAFSGLYPAVVLLSMIWGNYLFKVGIEVIFTPITYKIVNLVKKYENLDTYDYNEKYNPLPLN
ncbi:MAG: transporter [Treponema sp.]|nr:MAG: transporter [Treponema sp.]